MKYFHVQFKTKSGKYAYDTCTQDDLYLLAKSYFDDGMQADIQILSVFEEPN